MATKKAGKKGSAKKPPAPVSKGRSVAKAKVAGKKPVKKGVVVKKGAVVKKGVVVKSPARNAAADRRKRTGAPPKKKPAPKQTAKPVAKNTGKPIAAKAPASPVRAPKPLVASAKPVQQPKPVMKMTAASVNGLGARSVPANTAPKVAAAVPPAMAAKPSAYQAPVAPIASPKPIIAPKPMRPGERLVPKERITMEFMVHSAPNVLYELISTPSGFSEWYCDDVNVRGDQFTFIWGGEEEATTLVGRKAPEVIRFHRNNDPDETTFFEFRIRIDAMTNEVALIVTDHALAGEVEETRSLWASQIASLVRVLGA